MIVCLNFIQAEEAPKTYYAAIITHDTEQNKITYTNTDNFMATSSKEAQVKANTVVDEVSSKSETVKYYIFTNTNKVLVNSMIAKKINSLNINNNNTVTVKNTLNIQ